MTSAAIHLKHMCRELPEEILVSNVLPRLPMASLCRFRAVCKTWNALLTQNDFGAQHALVSPAEEFVLITSKFMHVDNSLKCWNVLDVANTRVFPLSHNFLATPSPRCGNIPGQRRTILASDGGLLCVMYDNNQVYSLVVCNPILKAVKVIPLLLQEWNRWTYDDDGVVMFTDKLSMEYEILVFHPMHHHYQASCMDFFESKTGKWRRVVNTGMPSPGSWFRISNFVKFKSALYRLYQSGDNIGRPYLVEFNKMTGVGSMLDFAEPFLGDRDCNTSSPTLIVSTGRLFCVYRLLLEDQNSDLEGQNSELSSMEIFEVFPERHKWESLARMPGALLHWLDGNDLNPAWKVNFIQFMKYNTDPIVPIGCASSILFFSGNGRFVAYDLTNKLWHQFSHSHPLQLDKGPRRSILSLFWSNFGLSLCPP